MLLIRDTSRWWKKLSRFCNMQSLDLASVCSFPTLVKWSSWTVKLRSKKRLHFCSTWMVMSRNPGQGHATVVQLLLENKADVSHSFDEADLLEMIRGVSLGHQKSDITRQDCSSVYRIYFYIQGLKCGSVIFLNMYIYMYIFINIYICVFDDINTFGPLGASPQFFQKKWVIHKTHSCREGVSAAWPPTSWQNVQDIRRRLDVGSPETWKQDKFFFVVGVLVVIFGHLWSECRNIDVQDLYETLGEHSCA